MKKNCIPCFLYNNKSQHDYDFPFFQNNFTKEGLSALVQLLTSWFHSQNRLVKAKSCDLQEGCASFFTSFFCRKQLFFSKKIKYSTRSKIRKSRKKQLNKGITNSANKNKKTNTKVNLINFKKKKLKNKDFGGMSGFSFWALCPKTKIRKSRKFYKTATILKCQRVVLKISWDVLQITQISKWFSHIPNQVPHICFLRASNPSRFIKLRSFLCISVLALKS